MKILFKILWILIGIALIWLPATTLGEQYGELYVDPDTAALWHLNGNGDDETGTNNCTAYGTATITQFGKFGQAYSFSGGSDDGLVCGTNDSLNLTSNFTLIVWIYPTGWGQGTWGRILNRTGTVGAYWLGYDWYVSDTGDWGNNDCMDFYYFYDISYNYEHVESDNNSIILNTWQQIAIVYNGSYLYAYINGSLSGSNAASHAPFSASGLIFYIGIRQDLDREFAGRIDEIIVFTRALSAEEIRQIYALQAGAFGIH